jgi:hypothetical protein
MELFQPFSAHYGATSALTITAAQSTVVFTPQSANPQILLTNVGTAVIFVRIQPTSDTTAASATDVPILPNTKLVLTRGTGEAFTLRATAAGAGSTLYVTPGIGF